MDTLSIVYKLEDKSHIPISSIKGDVKKKHLSLRIRGRGVSDIQPLTAAASSVPERGCARRVLEIRMHRNPCRSCRVEAPLSSTVASANHGSIGDSRPIALLGCPRGHMVARETVCLTRPRILTLEPVRSATAGSSQTMTSTKGPGAARSRCLGLQIFGVERFSFLPNT